MKKIFIIVAILFSQNVFSQNVFLQELVNYVKNPAKESNDYLLAKGFTLFNVKYVQSDTIIRYRKGEDELFLGMTLSKKNGQKSKEVTYITTDKVSFALLLGEIKNNFIIKDSNRKGDGRYINFENDSFYLQLYLTPTEGESCSVLLIER